MFEHVRTPQSLELREDQRITRFGMRRVALGVLSLWIALVALHGAWANAAAAPLEVALIHGRAASKGLGGPSEAGHKADGMAATVVNVVPEAGTVTAARTTFIIANFSSDLDPTTATDANVKMFGSMSGAVAGTISTPAASQIFIQPSVPFVRGETVTVTLSSGIMTAGGQPVTPYQWSFTVAAEAGSGIFGTEQRIQSGDSGADNMTTGDVDGDGDIDLIGSPPGGGLAWYENDGMANFTPRTLSSTGAVDLKAVDLDGDGHLDVLAASGDAVTWYRNDGAATPSFTSVNVASAGGMRAVSVADMDGDGDLDVISGALNAFTKVGWSENQGGVFGARQAIANDGTVDAVLRVEAADVDGDGDGDVVASWLDRDEVVLYENLGLAGFTPHVVSNDPRVFALEIADLDQDGDLDIVAASRDNNTVTGYLNQGGNVFSSTVSIDGAASGVVDIHPVDIDADGDLDLVAAQGNIGGFSLALYTNAGGTSFTRTALNGASSASANGVAAADLDGDGDLDIAASFGFGFISWFGQEPNTFTIEHIAPAQAALGVARGDNISATFSSSVDPLTVVSNVVVRGSQSGVMVGNFSFPNSRTIVFNPINDFFPGERVQVTLASGLQGANGMAATPHVWEFSTAVARSDRVFAEAGVLAAPPSGFGYTDLRAWDSDGDNNLDLVAGGSGSGLIYLRGLSAGMFADPITILNALVFDIELLDVNVDGHLDVVASTFAKQVVWVPNNGDGTFGAEQVIETVSGSPVGLHSGDVDGDGDTDLVASWLTPPHIKLYQQQGGGVLNPRSVSSHAGLGVELADLDGDGDLDLAAGGPNALVWHANDGTGTFGTPVTIVAGTNMRQPYRVQAADMDGDGDLDLVLGMRSVVGGDVGEVAWYESDGAQMPTFTEHSLHETRTLVEYLDVKDVDGDGDLDILFPQGAQDAVMVNDGSGNFDVEVIGVTGSLAVDLDRDGDLDIFSGHTWSENLSIDLAMTGSSPANMAVASTSSTNLVATFDAPLDAATVNTTTVRVDGSLTGRKTGMVSASGNQLTFDPSTDFLPGERVVVSIGQGVESTSGDPLYASQWTTTIATGTGASTFQPGEVITADAAGATVIAVADLDGDGDMDALSASYDNNTIAWYENNGAGAFTRHILSATAIGPVDLTTADLDGDGDMDVMAALFNQGSNSNRYVWYQNGGDGTFSEHIIDASPVFASRMQASDLDGDGDLDIVAAALTEMTWYENDGAATPSFTKAVLLNSFSELGAAGPASLIVNDLNNDGYGDVSIISRNQERLAWFANNGAQAFTEHIVSLDESSTDGLRFGSVGDLDGDGDGDFLIADYNDDTIGWHANNGDGTFGTRIVISTALDGPTAAHAADVDGDGDLDIVATSELDDTVAWFENQGGASFAAPVILATDAGGAYMALSADFDGDGDLDVLASSATDNTIRWFRQGAPPAFSVASAMPATNALNVAQDANLSITFTEAVNQGSVTAATFRVQGSQSGPIDGTLTFPTTTQLVFDSTTDLLPGETVQVQLTSGVTASGGAALTPYRVSFTVAAASGASAFGAYNVLDATANSPIDMYPVDLDQDGDVDMVTASASDDTVAWYENLGNGTYSAKNVITTATDFLHSVVAADLDGDGDLDVASAASSTFFDDVSWYQNDGAQNFTKQTLSTADPASTIRVADVDGDGDLDLITASPKNDSISWYTNQGSGTFAGPSLIAAGTLDPRSLELADLDGDGDPDLVAALQGANSVVVYTNVGGSLDGGHPITTTAQGAYDVFVADLDGDGDLDIAVASETDNTVAWYANDGSGAFGAAQVVASDVMRPRTVHAGDVDGDGDLDLLASSNQSTLLWYANDGTGSFGAAQTIADRLGEFVDHITASDADQDGDVDVFVALNSFGWYENVPPIVNFSRTAHAPAAGATDVSRAAPITATFDADLDAASLNPTTFAVRGSQRGRYTGSFSLPETNQLRFDPAHDFFPGETISVVASPGVRSSTGGVLTPYQWAFQTAPTQGGGAFTEHLISTVDNGAQAAQAADMDGDGDMDVLTASFADNTIAWYENDGSQGFTKHVITASASSVFTVSAVDIDGDGDMDVVSGWFSGAQVVWHENDGNQSFTTHVVGSLSGAFSVHAADVDGDGDVDLITTSSADAIVWYENDGSQSFTRKVIGNAEGARSVYALDVDGDGDLDVLSASQLDDTIAWYENDGSQSFTKHVVATMADAAYAVYAVDIDGDGDVDVLSASFADHKVAWYENDGSQGFTEHALPTTAFNARSVYAADVDGDGDMDILAAAGNTIAWYMNDGNQGFTERVLTDQAFSAAHVYAADVDGDGDLDVLSASGNDNTIAWYEQVVAIPERIISGDAGWRMLSAPVSGFAPDDIADDTAIQGVPGGANTGSPSNLYLRKADATWELPASLGAPLGDGYGFILYFYNNTQAGSTELPLTLDAEGSEPSADVVVDVVASDFTLLGNPFARSIALDGLTGNGTGGTGNGLVSPIQVWDDGTGSPDWRDPASASGSFVPFNLGEGQVIAPWQGFMLQSADATQATIPIAARTGNAPTIEIFQRTYDDSLSVPVDDPTFRRIAFELEGPAGSGALDRSAQLYFHSAAHTGRDGYDGQKLVPLFGEYATLAFVAPYNAEQLLVQDARSLNPVEAEVYELAVSIAGLSGSFTLSWPELVEVPASWRVELRDRMTGAVINLRQSEQYVFESDPTTASASKLGAGPSVRAQSASETANRFELVVLSDVVSTSVDELFEVPDRVELLQNYPNPFNPSTTLRFALPTASQAEVSVYNALGQRVAVVADGVYGAGRHEVVWEASRLPSGVYVVRLQVGVQVQARTITLLK